MENNSIGHHAGLVWQQLNDNGAQTAAALKKSLDLTPAELERAIGWLAREDKLQFEKKGKSTEKIGLK